jgi:DNA adenine methylase
VLEFERALTMRNASPQIRLPEIRFTSGELKPPLKWAGGKRWLVPTLEPIWKKHSHRRLVEPFCGGLAVALGLSPVRALLNDVNPHLMSFYRWLKRGLTITIPLENDEALYYRHRDRFNELLATGQADSAEAAALFYYLNRTGYNGLCRFNKSGEFNVPFGQYRTINYVKDFSEYGHRFADWELVNVDIEELPVEPHDFLYADPPYDVEFTQYSRGGFDWNDQVRTAEWLAKHRGPVALSNQATERVVELYQRLGFELRFLEAPRMISCNGDRSKAREVLAIKNLR